MNSKSSRLAGALFVLLGFVIALPARAEPQTLAAVAVALEPEQEGRTLEIWRALEAAAAKDARYAYVDVARLGVSDATGRNEAEARAAFEAARKAYVNLDMAGAAEKSDQALGLLESVEQSRSFPRVLEALALKAMALQAQESPAAADALAELYTVAPYYRFSATQTNPRFMAVAERVRQTVTAAPGTTLKISPREVTAWVFVDGAYRGTSPLELNTLLPGKHYVEVLAPGFEPRQAVVITRVVTEETFAPTMAPSASGRELRARLEQLSAGLRQRAFAKAADAFRSWAGTSELLVVAVGREGRSAQVTLLRCSAEGTLRETPDANVASNPEALARAALGLLDRSVVAPVEARASPASSNRISPVWGYASLGAGAFAALGGALLGIDARTRASQTREIPQLDDATYQRTVAAVRGQALLADGLFGVALVGAGVGTWLLLSAAEASPSGGAGAGRAERIRFGVAPSREGGVVTVSGRF